MKGLLSAIMLLAFFGAASAIIIKGDAGSPTKIQGGMNITLQPVYNEISTTKAKAYYVFNTTGALAPFTNFRWGLASLTSQMESGSILNATAYPITSINRYIETRNNRIRSRANYTLGAASSMNSGGIYMLEITTTPFAKGNWSSLFGLNVIDPNISACGHLNPQDTYTLTTDLVADGSDTYCITFDKDNTIFDCAGFSISNPFAFDTAGIGMQSLTNNVIKNCIIKDFANSVGVDAGGSTFSFIQNTTFNNTGIGVNLNAPTETFSVNFSRFYNTPTGIGASEMYSSNISSNNFSNVSIGFEIGGSIGNYFQNNQMTNISTYGFYITGDESLFIDCNGKNIQGNNITDSYGIVIQSSLSEIKNCNVSNFDVGAYLASPFSSSTISNSNFSSTKSNYIAPAFSSAVYSVGSVGITLNAVRATSTVGAGIFSDTGTASFIIDNSSGTSVSDSGIACVSNGGGSGGIKILRSNATSSTGQALWMGACPDATIFKVNARSNTSNAGFFTTSHRMKVNESTFSSNTAAALEIASSQNNTILNNTLYGNSTLLKIYGASDRNNFYFNNFTNSSGLYVNDTNGSNQYNATYNGKNQGNIYFNVLNGSVVVNGTTLADIPPYYIGTTGAVPYNNTSSLGKFMCSFAGCADYAPLTPTLLVCSGTINYSSAMTPSGLVFTRPTGNGWLMQLFNGIAAAACFNNYTAYIYDVNGSLLSALSSANNATTQLNNTFSLNPAINQDITIKANVSLFGVGFNASTETRTYYILQVPNPSAGTTGAAFEIPMWFWYIVLFGYVGVVVINLGRDFVKGKGVSA